MTDTVANYLPQFFSRAVLNAVIALDSGAQAATWHSAPGYDAWGSGLATDEYEYASLRTVNGVEYAYSDGFGNADKSTFYPMEGVWDRMTINGTTVDLVLPGGPNGMSYLPRNLPDSGVIEVHQGGFIWDRRGGARARPFFWYGHFLFGTTRTNSGFQGEPKTIKVTELREGWWDSAGGWVRCHPQTAGELPWTLVNNVWVPNQNIIVVTEQLDCIGRDVGHLWVGQDRDLPLHLQSITYGPELVPVTPAPKPPEVKVADESLLIAALDRNTAAINSLAARLSGVYATPAPSPIPPTPIPPPSSPGPSPSAPAPSGGGSLTWPAHGQSLLKGADTPPAAVLEFDIGPVGAMLHRVGRVQFSGGPNTWRPTLLDSADNVVATSADSATPYIYFVTDGGADFPNLVVGERYKARYERITSEDNNIPTRCDLYV